MIRIIGLCLVLVSTFGFAESKVVITTNIGEIELKLFDEQAPESVANFLSYSEDGFYDETLFHRVIPNFMIQGGGFEKGLIKKSTKAPIKNEAKSIVPNRRGTIAMARTNDPHSATSQFFINVIDNNFLNKSVAQAGYAVFGEVTSGMEIVDRISTVKTGQRGPYRDVPIDDVMILSVKKVN